MHEYKDVFSVEKMALLLGVSRSGYYRYIQAPLSQRSQRDVQLLEQIKVIFEASRQTYGSPRIYQALKAQGEVCSEKRVARLMKENHLIAKATRLYKVTTKANKTSPIARNRLRQNFTANKPNQKWTSDITHIWTAEGWLYLAVILDLYSRYVVGISMSARMTKQLVIKAFKQAMLHRGYPKELIYHSDRGSQYTSHEFQSLLADYRIKASMSGAGNCYDNAATESFFHTLKTECIYHERYQTREQAETSIFDYIAAFYNSTRRHSYLNYLSPREFEKNRI